MPGDFTARIDQLLLDIPKKIKGSVEVDQVYAHYQHAHPEFEHPDGGEAFYLQTPLFSKSREYLGKCARSLNQEGFHLVKAMSEAMEDLSTEVYHRAPWEFGDLRASGHPKVEADGEVVYDRAPLCPRLSEEELRVKNHLRYLLDPHRYLRN